RIAKRHAVHVQRDRSVERGIPRSGGGVRGRGGPGAALRGSSRRPRQRGRGGENEGSGIGESEHRCGARRSPPERRRRQRAASGDTFTVDPFNVSRVPRASPSVDNTRSSESFWSKVPVKCRCASVESTPLKTT